MIRDASSRISGHWDSYDQDTAQATPTDLLRVSGSRDLTRDIPGSTPESDAPLALEAISGQQTGGACPSEERDVVVTDKQVKSESDGPSSKRREICLDLTFSDEQVIALLADDRARAAIAHVDKDMRRDEEER